MSTLRCGTRSGSLSFFRLKTFNLSMPDWHTQNPFLKEDEPIRCDKLGFVILLLVILMIGLATSAMAAQHDWAGPANGSRHIPGNWGGTVSGVPVAGNSVWLGNANGTIDFIGGPVIPDPSTFAIWALGLLGLLGWGWRRRFPI